MPEAYGMEEYGNITHSNSGQVDMNQSNLAKQN